MPKTHFECFYCGQTVQLDDMHSCVAMEEYLKTGEVV